MGIILNGQVFFLSCYYCLLCCVLNPDHHMHILAAEKGEATYNVVGALDTEYLDLFFLK